MSTASFNRRILNNAVARILLGLVICVIVFVLAQQLTAKLFEVFPLDRNSRNLLKGLVASAAVLLAYRGFYGRIEHRAVTELSLRGRAGTIGAGLGLGALLQGLAMLVIALFGQVQVLAVNPVASLIIPLTVAFSVAIFEEVLMRGILFRIAEEKLGSYLALAVSSVIFGLLHLVNPGATLLSGLCVVVAGGVFGLAYVATRSLWFPIALHFAWNFMQSGIFGAVTSGNDNTTSLLTTKLAGSTLITGGTFGPEASIQTVLVLLVAAGLLHRKAQSRLVAPRWKSKAAQPNDLVMAR
ncbi:hypothetical protein SAMN02745146_0065 [Hymenobacter daecheongensis DSM 21074]|uniref:CAAX prenyl protease 2/Lysostaphin resistance protein A-like domain-containing protein n=1 Tax=Hymenobacter daecheongensis DSM 21074 TaxID=1121955 RepID=A0A1M6LV29_9BACT|nr:type II CAAX endopeptidase family protein [Hymenobacter daecheongensis]SHJ75036.1 hypothetical protein SAMN02745146_0065 [Hymenobacter daecheongensis DSM 21074]